MSENQDQLPSEWPVDKDRAAAWALDELGFIDPRLRAHFYHIVRGERTTCGGSYDCPFQGENGDE